MSLLSSQRCCGFVSLQHCGCCCRHRVQLVPLRFGAGVKGKVRSFRCILTAPLVSISPVFCIVQIADSWMSGTPVVTTSIGAEGMTLPATSDSPPFYSSSSSSSSFAGAVADTPALFASAALRLHTQPDAFYQAQRAGVASAAALFDARRHSAVLSTRLRGVLADVRRWRAGDVAGGVQCFATNRYTTYFSKYVALKAAQRLVR